MAQQLVNKLFLALLFVIPLSTSFTFGHHQINLPGEPIILLLSVLLFFVVDFKDLIIFKFIRHPVSLISIGYLGWMIVTVPFSSDVVTSLKYVAVNISHWWVFFIGFWIVKRKIGQGMDNWFGFYAVGLSLVILYAHANNFKFDFRPDAGLLLAQPFFRDHALFSAVICMLIFYFLDLIFKQIKSRNWTKRSLLGPMSFSFLALSAVYFIPSRAAWLSLILALTIGLACLAIKLRWSRVLASLFALGFASAIIVPRIFGDPIKTEARTGNMVNQLQSGFNFTTDVSNLERLNRYHCAWHMFLDRPLLGFGPGTFASAYLPFQKESYMTRISVRKPHREDGSPHQEGRGGGAHSEYLQALSEMGGPGFLLWMAFVGVVIITGIRIFFRSKNQDRSFLFLSITLGLITYFIHGIFNNFLHDEELAAIFWAMLAHLVIKDLEKENSALSSF